MNNLHLYKGEQIQGEFQIKKINALLTFQVNCPGCFLYALPFFNELYKKYNDNIGFLALSTAFENFDLNTTQNTKNLIENGILIGHTKKALYEYGIDSYSTDLLFPIAMDKKMEQSEKEELVSQICHLNPNYITWSSYDQGLLKSRVTSYINALPEVSLTFTANQFRGTPTIVVFNEKKEILKSWFGHQPKSMIEEAIKSYIS